MRYNAPMIYRGTSTGYWVLEGIAWILAAAALVWLLVELLQVILILGLLAVAAFLLWWAWLEIGDRRRGPTPLDDADVMLRLYPRSPRGRGNVDVLR